MDASIPFETELKTYLQGHLWLRFDDYTNSYHELDLRLIGRTHDFHLELKEKKQPYKRSSWPDTGVPWDHLFILDDLSARKVLFAGTNAGIAIRDKLLGRYVFMSVVDLAMMPKVRFNRETNFGGSPDVKGKWAIDLRNGVQSTTLDQLISSVGRYVAGRTQALSMKQCWGEYPGEEIRSGGIPRNLLHLHDDLAQAHS